MTQDHQLNEYDSTNKAWSHILIQYEYILYQSIDLMKANGTLMLQIQVLFDDLLNIIIIIIISAILY